MTTITDNPRDTITVGGAPVNVGERISLNPAYPPVAYDLLLNIVAWAEHDSRFSSWGIWNQGSWASVYLDGDIKPALEELANSWQDAETGRPASLIASQANVLVQSAARANVCRSAFCMAGQTVYQAGFRMILDDSPLHRIGEEAYADDCIAEVLTDERDERGFMVWRDREDAERIAIDQAAAEILGLIGEERCLFEGDNTVPKIKSIVNWIAENRHLPIPFPDEPTYPDEDDYDGDE